MNWLKKGPELKLPKLRRPSLGGSGDAKGSGLKPPAFLADLYYDLRDRRLLPLIALVVVAIAAVPILLGSDVEEPALPPAAGAALESSTANASKLTVVEATPGLRDYKKRLKDRSPSDPFEQQYTEPAGGGSSSSEGGSSSSSSFSETITTEDSSTTGEVEGGGSSGGGGGSGSGAGSGADGGTGAGGGGGEARLIEFVFDLQISRTEATPDGGQKMGEPEVRRRVPTLAQLPGKQTPVVTVTGVNLHNGKVWFLVSDDVKSLDGDFTCVTRTPAGLCELLEIDAGFPLEPVYGENDVRYRIKVTRIDAVWAGKVGDGSRSSRASFGGSAMTVLPNP